MPLSQTVTLAAAYDAATPCEIGSRVSSIRRAAGLTQREVGRAAGLSPAMVSRIESGQRKASLEAMSQIGARLGVRVDLLLGVEELVDPASDLKRGLAYLRSLPPDSAEREGLEAEIRGALGMPDPSLVQASSNPGPGEHRGSGVPA